MNPDNVATQPTARGNVDSSQESIRISPAGSGTEPTPLTGRDTEVGLLSDRWEQAQEGMGQIVLLIGGAGLGKSRLVRTIKEIVIATAESDSAAQQTAHSELVVEWRCSERRQNSGLHPISDYFTRLLNLDPREAASKRFDKLASHLEENGMGQPEVVALFAKLLFLPADERYPSPGLPPVRERVETFRAVRQWLRAQADRRPFLFVVEDLHWVDASSLEFLHEFIAEGLHDRILTVLTFRPELETPWPAVAHQTSLALNRLTRRHVAQLIRKIAGRPVPDSLISQIYERTNGVPLLVEEFVKLVDGSLDVRMPGSDGNSEMTAHGGTGNQTGDMPSTLQELVLERLDRMSINREVAQLAATLGREFHYELLAAVTSVDEVDLMDELAKLANADILFAKGNPPRCTFLFKHTLLEEALHSSLREEPRRNSHRLVGEIMEKRFSQTSANQPELLAWHFTEAGQIEKAIEYWLKAGLRARDQFANIEAINHLTKGLALLGTLGATPENEVRELKLLNPLGTAYIAAHGYAAPEVAPVFSRARTLCERVGTKEQLFATMRGNFAFHIVRGDYRLCSVLADEAVEFGELQDDPGILMEALFLKGLTMLYRGDFGGARDCFVKALTEYDDRERTAYWATMTGEDSGVTHRCYLALAWWHLGYPDRALNVNREARKLARATGIPFNIEYALHHTGWLCQHCRFGVGAQSAGEEEIAIATEQGFKLWHATGTLYSAAGLLLQGNIETGLRLIQQGVEHYRATGAGLALPYYLCLLGDALMHSGRFEEAHLAIDEALGLADKNDERFQEAELYRLKGELRLAESDDDASAEHYFLKAITIARGQGNRAWELRATLSLARLWHRQGHREKAFADLNAAFSAFDEGFTTPDLADAAALLGELANERMRKDLAAGLKYIHDCIPPPRKGVVSIDWRYVPSSTLGGDTIGFHWLDDEHLALYLIDVTGHGLDAALLSVTIHNIIRTSSLRQADMKRPEDVLARLNETFPGNQHSHKFFTAWYGVYRVSTRTLSYASGGHPSALIVSPGDANPLELPATGPMMGILPATDFPASTFQIPPDARLLIFSDGAFEILRDRKVVWNLPSCIAYLAELGQRDENLMDQLLSRARHLRGSSQLDDDFSVIEVRLH
jgi:predicted ATPase